MTMNTTIRLTGLVLGTLMLVSSAANAEPWMVQLVLESSPDEMHVLQTNVSDCEARDFKAGGSGMTVELQDAASGRALNRFELIDPRMVFVEPPDEGKWMNKKLVQVGSMRMFERAYHVLSFPLGDFDRDPPLPLILKFTNEAGDLLLEAPVDTGHIIPAKELGCERTVWTGAAIGAAPDDPDAPGDPDDPPRECNPFTGENC